MIFVFQAHRPNAYFRFAIVLIVLTLVNLFALGLLFPQLRNANETAVKSIILVLPWIILLLLPTIVLAVIIYRSFVKTYRFTLDQEGILVERLKKEENVNSKKFLWREVKTIHVIDFEDNHYCNLEFSEKKNNLVIHRESGDFEKFYEEMGKHVKIEIED